MKLIGTVVGITVVAALVLSAGPGGCRDRIDVLGDSLVERTDRLLGEDEVRIARIERELGELRRIRESQRIAKYEAQVRAELYERRAAAATDKQKRANFEGLAKRSRSIEQRAGQLMVASDTAVHGIGRQLQVLKDKYRLLKQIRTQADHTEHIAVSVDPHAVGEHEDSITETINNIEARLCASTERAELAVGVLATAREEDRE